MKIGILTYHRAENYGALLQAYALKTYLTSLGHEVSFVDYWPDYHRDYFALFSWKRFCKSNLRSKLMMIYYLLFYTIRKKRKDNLRNFMYSGLGLSKDIKYTSNQDVCENFDVVFYGSDQIWRKQGLIGHPGFDFWYFGSENIKCQKKVAYAASMGKMDIDEGEKSQIHYFLQKFDNISVRELPLKQFVTSFGMDCQLVIDPVFLLPAEEWRRISASNAQRTGEYILLYNLLNSKDTVLYAEQLSRQTHLPILEISKRYSPTTLGERYNHTAKVEEFISLIDNAKYVVSNSFHGVAFSIILHKQFYATGMGNRAGRVKSLLSVLGLDRRYIDITHNDNIEEIDYGQVDQILQREICNSKNYIILSLS